MLQNHQQLMSFLPAHVRGSVLLQGFVDPRVHLIFGGLSQACCSTTSN
jgi:hypothetical protein